MLQPNREPETETARKLLIVDDDLNIRLTLKEIGETLGYEVDLAEDGERGSEIFRQFKPDIVILDVYMPNMNGVMLMSRIRGMDCNCPVIMITGYGHYKNMVESRKIAPDGFILKPFKLQVIAQMMSNLLKKRDKGLIASKNKHLNIEYADPLNTLQEV